MSKKKVAIILLVVAIVAVGGFFAYKYFIQKDKTEKKPNKLDDYMKEIPSQYEDLQWGSSYEDVYDFAYNRGEKIVKQGDNNHNLILDTTRNGYEGVEGTVDVRYYVNDNSGLVSIVIMFDKDKCKQDLKKISNYYNKRLKKYCEYLGGGDLESTWATKEGISYYLCGGEVLFEVQIFNPDLGVHYDDMYD